MENTLENKSKFFAQYWGQTLLTDGVQTHNISSVFNLKHESFYLKLNALSQITDEDAIELGVMCGLAMNYIHNSDSYRMVLKDDSYKLYINYTSYIWMEKNGAIYHQATLKCYDYLRSKGYALPYMGLSVEKQIEYGWIKLIE